jgi:hypothetical protein
MTLAVHPSTQYAHINCCINHLLCYFDRYLHLLLSMPPLFVWSHLQLPESLCQSWATTPPSPQLHLPPPNPYIPSDFTVRGLHAHQQGAAQMKKQGGAAATSASGASEASPTGRRQPGRQAKQAAAAANGGVKGAAAAAVATAAGSSPNGGSAVETGEQGECIAYRQTLPWVPCL